MLSKKYLIVILIVLVCTSGCTSTYDNNVPSDVIKQFVDLQKKGNYQETYNLLSEEFQNENDLTTFVNQLKNSNSEFDAYELIEIGNESTIIEGNQSSMTIYVISQSNISVYLESLSNESIIDESFIEIRNIELVREESGWKLTKLYPELAVNTENSYKLYR
ncbi:hypothetical protein HNV12_14755 [Methanococcoides sp. SA1]|nr:hypothetical protein [Methanococcoides sp. SA1]